VSISGSTAVIGTPDKNGLQGAAYIFEKSSGVWPATETQKITASDAEPSDRFGFAVSISRTTIIVGARNDDLNRGSAYIFEKSGGVWPATETQKITAIGGIAGDLFGSSVSISGSIVVVGAQADDGIIGSAYIFENIVGVWSQVMKLTPSDGDVGDRFGFSASISGDIAVVGTRNDDGLRGAAYIFEKSGGVWPATETQKITANDGVAGDQFGQSVSISCNALVVGANFDHIGTKADQGSAYVFQRSNGTWSQTLKLTATDGLANDQFGFQCRCRLYLR
jgi:hypothetical protein